MKTKIWYSVQNCGDGSAYPKWVESEELADWDQRHMSEGWGESCTGTLEIEHDGPIKVVTEVETTLCYYLENYREIYDYEKNYKIKEREKFLKEFFPDGLPEVKVKILDDKYYGIFTEDGKLHNKEFAYDHETDTVQTSEEEAKKLEKELNG